MTSIAEVLNRRRPPELSVDLLLDGGLAVELDALERRLALARLGDEKRGGLVAEAPALEAELEALRERASSSVVTFIFRGLPRAKLADLTRRYPPSEEQWSKFRELQKGNPFLTAPDFDVDAMAPELLSASCVDPSMNLEDARRLWDELSDGEAAQLWKAAWQVNTSPPVRPIFGIGTATTKSSDPDSNMQLNEAFL